MNEFDIKSLRKEIDSIDNELRDLLKRRMEVVNKINEYKEQNNLPVLDSSREEEIINSIKDQYKNDELVNYYIELQKKIMEISKDYQNKKRC